MAKVRRKAWQEALRFLKTNYVFAMLSEGEQELVLEHLQIERLPRKERIYSEGERIRYFYILVEGCVKVFREGIGGNAYIHLARPGHFFNIRPYFIGDTQPYNAETYSPTTIYKLPIRIVEEILSSNCKVCRYAISALAGEIDMQEKRNICLLQKQMRGRLAETLLLLTDLYGYEDDGHTLGIQLSRVDLAMLSYMTPSNVSRTLSAFALERILSLERKKIKIMSLSGLQHISDLG